MTLWQLIYSHPWWTTLWFGMFLTLVDGLRIRLNNDHKKTQQQ